MNCLNPITTHFIVPYFVCPFLTELNKSMPCYNNKSFPLAVMPMFTFDDSRFADIDADLTVVKGMDKFSKGTPLIYIQDQ